MKAGAGLGERGTLALRWVLMIVLICAVALGGGFAVGFALGS